jgi:hypothetical protein
MYPAVEESLRRLHHAHWSVAGYATATRQAVSGSNGENVLCAEGNSRAEGWWRACEQAAVGMLAPARGRSGV